MDKTYAFTKIILAAIGIFFAIRLLAQLPTPIWLAITNPSHLSVPIALALFWIAFLGLCLAALLYVFLYMRQELAKKIVGTGELAEPDSKILWLPAAFRLVCIAAGLYSLNLVIWNTTHILATYFMYESQVPAYTAKVLSTEQILTWLLMVAMGIYLVCGAPHFVRWQVRKTLEQCKTLEETKQ